MGLLDELGQCAASAKVGPLGLCGEAPPKPTPKDDAKRPPAPDILKDNSVGPYGWQHKYMPADSDRNPEKKRTVPNSDVQLDNYGYGYTNKRIFVPEDLESDLAETNKPRARNWRHTFLPPEKSPANKTKPSFMRLDTIDLIEKIPIHHSRDSKISFSTPIRGQFGDQHARCRRRIHKIMDDDRSFRELASGIFTQNGTVSSIEVERCRRSALVKLRKGRVRRGVRTCSEVTRWRHRRTTAILERGAKKTPAATIGDVMDDVTCKWFGSVVFAKRPGFHTYM
jgi:hypothetical protein